MSIEKIKLHIETTLVKCLKKQYQHINTSDNTLSNIDLLDDENSFTITTGHQLNLFTGPIYFIYKIIEVIKICKLLKEKYPEYSFIPLYWMATEDHDFEEINHFKFKENKITWNTKQTGRVGKFSTKNLKNTLYELKKILPLNHITKDILKLFENSYLKHSNLTDATRYLVNDIFKSYGLVILDADDRVLKKLFTPYFKNEITENNTYKFVQKTNIFLKKHKYKVQVSPREINLFYMYKDIRERIEEKNGKFQIINTDIKFTEQEILTKIENHPEHFSPNVILRPLYQEVILPNICYVGGSGEIAYWLQLKDFFRYYNRSLPILKVRNSIFCTLQKAKTQMEKLNISFEELFLPLHELINKKVKQNNYLFSEITQHKSTLKKIFIDIHQTAEKTDKSFLGAVNAEQTRQQKGLNRLIKRLEKAEKQKQHQKIQMTKNLYHKLFPNGKLQERELNFFEILLQNKNLIENIINHNNPFENGITLITY